MYLNLVLHDIQFNALNFRHKFLCEVSPHVIYQYVFIIFWFLFNMGILIASYGFILHICKHIRMMGCRFKSGLTEASLIMEIHASLTFREIEYLEYIKVRNLSVYGEVLRKLLKYKPNLLSGNQQGLEYIRLKYI